MNKENIYRIDMKYILLTAVSFYSLSAMQKPAAKPAAKQAAKPKNISIEERIIQLQEHVKEIKEKQILTISRVATAMNDNFLPDNADQSILIPVEQVKQMTPETFAASVDLKIEIQVGKSIQESWESIRRLTESHRVLENYKSRKRRGKKLTPNDELNELASFHQVKQAAEESLKKVAELHYYLDAYYAEEKNKPTKVLVEQED